LLDRSSLTLDQLLARVARGSVGASSDLAPLAHLALVLVGEGEVFAPCRARDRAIAGADTRRRPSTSDDIVAITELIETGELEDACGARVK
jgi:histidine ammonia-lyase